MRCFAFSFPQTFNVNAVINELSQRYKVDKIDEVIFVKVLAKDIDQQEGLIFIFPYGVIVCWGLTEQLEQELCALLRNCWSEKLGAEDDDLYTYSYGKNAAIQTDHIVLPDRQVYTKLACSYGLAQSVKLGGFENTIQNLVGLTRKLPEDLSTKGKIQLSRKEIRKLMGKIFIDRSSINLHLELLDAPNFFWEHTELEPLHEMVTDYLDQKRRMDILNQRLSVLQELLDMLAAELNNQHSSKLEWIIIALIFIEVTVMFSKEILHIL